jgi:hypothetical protein
LYKHNFYKSSLRLVAINFKIFTLNNLFLGRNLFYTFNKKKIFYTSKSIFKNVTKPVFLPKGFYKKASTNIDKKLRLSGNIKFNGNQRFFDIKNKHSFIKYFFKKSTTRSSAKHYVNFAYKITSFKEYSSVKSNITSAGHSVSNLAKLYKSFFFKSNLINLFFLNKRRVKHILMRKALRIKMLSSTKKLVKTKFNPSNPSKSYQLDFFSKIKLCYFNSLQNDLAEIDKGF